MVAWVLKQAPGGTSLLNCRKPVDPWRLRAGDRRPAAVAGTAAAWGLPVNIDWRNGPTHVTGVYRDVSCGRSEVGNFPQRDFWLAWVHFNGSGVDADITGRISRRGGDLMRRLPAGPGDTPKKRTASLPSLLLHQSETKEAHRAIIMFGLAHTDQSTCTGNTSAGAACRRRVNAGETHCWQHARGMRQKWHSLTRNQSLLFVFAAISVITGAIALVTSVFPQFWEMSIVPNSSSSENPQVPQPDSPPRATVSPLPQAPSILIVGTASGFPGAVIDLPMTFESGQQNDVCGLGFELTFPSQLSYVSLAPGPSATESNQAVLGNALGTGRVRVLTIGGILKSGVIAIVRLKISERSTPGRRPLPVAAVGLSATTPDAKPSPVKASSGDVYIKSRSLSPR